MAQIGISDLINIVMNHPDYKSKWELGVPANQVLYISFSKNSADVESEVFTAADGSEIVLDVTKSGEISGIEIL